MNKDTKRNGWEKIAAENITNAFNWIVGGLELAVEDQDMTKEAFEAWVHREGVDEVYFEAVHTAYYPDMAGGPAMSKCVSLPSSGVWTMSVTCLLKQVTVN